MYDTYASNFYEDLHVEFYNLDFKAKQRFDELEHTALIINWISNMDKQADTKQ